MNARSRSLIWMGLAALALVATVGAVYSLRRRVDPVRHVHDTLPGPGSETYQEMVSAFYAGVAALDVDANDRAREKLRRATELVPGEPAAWADLGLLELRLGNFEA